MALVSPGVQVSIIDESIYAPAAVGTVPFILIATAENKTQPGSSSLAAGTTADNAERVYNITSQRDLVNTFGAPYFESVDNTPVNGSEMNEYGLLTAYSALAVCNSAYVQRADVDLGALAGTTQRPTQNPATGTYWLDTDASSYGIYEWNAATQAFTEQSVMVITDADDLTAVSSPGTDANVGSLTIIDNLPSATIGTVGSYAVDATNQYNPVFYKGYDGQWVLVGSAGWSSRIPTAQFTLGTRTLATAGNLNINNTNISLAQGAGIANVVTAINGASGLVGVRARASADNSTLIITANVGAGYNGIDGITIRSTSDANTSPTSTSVKTLLGLSTTQATSFVYPRATTAQSPFNQVPRWQTSAGSTAAGTGSVWQKTGASGRGMSLAVKRFNAVTQQWESQSANSYDSDISAIYALDRTGGGRLIPQGTLFNSYGPAGTQTSDNARTPEDPALLTTVLMRKRTAENTDMSVTGNVVFANTTVLVPNTTISSGTWITSLVYRATPSAMSDTTANISWPTADYANGITVGNLITRINSIGNNVITAELNSAGRLVIHHRNGGSIYVTETGGGRVLERAGIVDSVEGVYPDLRDSGIKLLTNFHQLSEYNMNEGYVSDTTSPRVEPPNNTLWYWDSPTRADILIKSSGGEWVSYRNQTSDYRGFNLSLTDELGPIFSASEPTLQSDGETALAYGDLWIDTGDLENYPMIYRWSNVEGTDQWVLIDKTDATTPAGIIFADARWGTMYNINPATDTLPAISDLLTAGSLANGAPLDLDAPDPALYPEGMLLFNTRASSYGVKQYRETRFSPANWPEAVSDAGNNINQDDWQQAAWVTVSGVDSRGLPNFGRKAQRGFVVAKLQAAIDSSTALREEASVFNLICCPGYPELLDNMVALNNDRESTAFVIGDAPLRLPATGTAIQAWASNTDSQNTVNEPGLSVASEYAAVYYPHAQTNDLSGATVVMPASHVALRNMIRSDNASYPWFAPAGTRRGLIDNASAIGYIDADTGRFISVGVTEGLRDTMYNNKINPLSSIPGAGLMVYGQKTLSPNASSLDRINVARLVNYVRRQLKIATRPFIFEPNDTITRNSVQTVVSGFLVDLVAKRGIYDYLVICDESNNTSDRISRNELYVDVAIQPVKAVEFIYIPIRLKNPGDLEV